MDDNFDIEAQQRRLDQPLEGFCEGLKNVVQPLKSAVLTFVAFVRNQALPFVMDPIVNFVEDKAVPFFTDTVWPYITDIRLDVGSFLNRLSGAANLMKFAGLTFALTALSFQALVVGVVLSPILLPLSLDQSGDATTGLPTFTSLLAPGAVAFASAKNMFCNIIKGGADDYVDVVEAGNWLAGGN